MTKLQWTGALALAALLTLPATEAEAGHRVGFLFAPSYGYYDPWYPPPRYYYYYDEPEQYYGYDERYYEPQYEEPAPRKSKKKKKTASTSEVNKKKKQTKAVTAEAKPKTNAMTCEKATSIVAGYGFGAVKAADCQGQVYAFNATRDGKAYAIKLSAASGELTEVKKLQ
jgi:hypothetical protein